MGIFLFCHKLVNYQAQYIILLVQNALLSALLAVVRGLSSPDEERVLSTVQLVTQLWLRMSPEQVRTPETHKYDCQWLTIDSNCHTPGPDTPCAAEHSAAAPVDISHFSEKHRTPSHSSGIIVSWFIWFIDVFFWYVNVLFPCVRLCCVWILWCLNSVRSLSLCWLLLSFFPSWGRFLFLLRAR